MGYLNLLLPPMAPASSLSRFLCSHPTTEVHPHTGHPRWRPIHVMTVDVWTCEPGSWDSCWIKDLGFVDKYGCLVFNQLNQKH